jgi:hypothetical protein
VISLYLWRFERCRVYLYLQKMVKGGSNVMQEGEITNLWPFHQEMPHGQYAVTAAYTK